MKDKAFNKVFCIGMNKTGTSSLHRALLALNLNSLHHGFSNYKVLKEHLESAKWIRDKILEFKMNGERL